jgi:crossover junction endodeoxyribonuclease RuvC
MVILGVDSGVSGALAAVTVSGQILWTDHMPTITHTSPRGKRTRLVDVDGLKAAIVAYSPAHAVIEAAASRPNQGVAGVFAYGRAYGVVEGVMGACDVPFTVVPPQVWKRHFSLSKKADDYRAAKAESLNLVRSMYGVDLPLVKDHGRAEAILIARWRIDTWIQKGVLRVRSV